MGTNDAGEDGPVNCRVKSDCLREALERFLRDQFVDDSFCYELPICDVGSKV
jgi:hypothetical protein